jgi:hypothetical protein
VLHILYKCVCVWGGGGGNKFMYVCMYLCRKYERYINALFEAYSKQRRAPLPVILHRFAVCIVTPRPFNSICFVHFHRKILERNLAKKSPCLSGVDIYMCFLKCVSDVTYSSFFSLLLELCRSTDTWK